MVFPFGENPPKKNKELVRVDIVLTHCKADMRKLFDYLASEGVKNTYKLEVDDKHHSFAVDLYHLKTKTFGLIGLHSHAYEVYNGAQSFNDVEAFIAYRQAKHQN